MTEKKFRVLEWAFSEDMGVNVVLREYADEVYTFISDDAPLPDPAANTSLPTAGNIQPSSS